MIDDVRDLNRRIKRELVRPRGGGGSDGFDVKNGEGGIREIEFFVQALQLIHAGKRPSLQARGTLAALDALLFAGLITDDEHLALWRAYRWLRHVEHVLQLEGGLQTQIVPDDDDAPAACSPGGSATPSDVAFAIDLVEHTAAVSRLFATLGDPADERADVTAILRGELTEAEEAAALTRLGFHDADRGARRARAGPAQQRLAAGPAAAASERTARIGAALLTEIAASADPDQALRTFGDLIARRGAAWSIWRLLDENPAIVRLLGSIFGASAYLARTLVDTPELIDLLIELGQTSPSRSIAQVAADLDAPAHRGRSGRPRGRCGARSPRSRTATSCGSGSPTSPARSIRSRCAPS